MTAPFPPQRSGTGVELVEEAVEYACAALSTVPADPLLRTRIPTPCAGWSLTALLEHLDGSVVELTQVALGEEPGAPAPDDADLPAAVRARLRRLLGACLAAPLVDREHPGTGGTAVLTLTLPVLYATAATEVTLHAWDVLHACTGVGTVPQRLAAGVLQAVHRCDLIIASDRGTRFATPVPSAPRNSASERLLAWSGRHP